MPPIPIYSQSPINAAKPDGETPQTAAGQAGAGPEKAPIITAAPDLRQQAAYPPAQPVAGPPPPAPTGASTSQYSPYVPAQPTTTTRSLDSQGPPPPQPGAVPTPYNPKATSTLPPPPKAGETYHPPQQTQAPTPTVPYPAQMTVPPPTLPYAQRGTSSATPGYSPQASNPLGTAGSAGGSNLAHPPGYHQDVNAADYGSHQRPMYQGQESSSAREFGGGGGAATGAPAEDDNVWGSAVKFVQAAGEKLSAAESEVWRRISKE